MSSRAKKVSFKDIPATNPPGATRATRKPTPPGRARLMEDDEPRFDPEPPKPQKRKSE